MLKDGFSFITHSVFVKDQTFLRTQTRSYQGLLALSQ